MASPFKPRRSRGPRRSPFHQTAIDYLRNVILDSRFDIDEHYHARPSTELALLEAISLRPCKRQRRCGSAQVLNRRLKQFQRRFETKASLRLRAPHLPVLFNLTFLGDLFELDDAQRSILQFVIAMAEHKALKDFLERIDDLHVDAAMDLIAAATRLTADEVRGALAPTGRLVLSGLIELDTHESSSVPYMFSPKRGLVTAVLTPDLDRRKLMGRYLPLAGPSTLEWSDVAQIATEARALRDLLATALRTRAPGINVLLYGPTGTGKTALAKLLAQDIGCELYSCGESDKNGDSANAHERLSSLMLGQRLIGSGSGVVLFDELEDLFNWHGWSGQRTAQMSKQWFNLLLERNPAPTIWICNDTSGMDKAFLRRFAFAIEFRPLGIEQRTRVLVRHLDGRSQLDRADVDAVARRFCSSAAVFANAVRSARMLAPGESPARSHIELVLSPIEKLVSGREPKRDGSIDLRTYDLDALNASENITSVAQRLQNLRPGDDRPVSLCLYGPPGTGKSAYVHHLASSMQRPLLLKCVSDILSPYIGESEKAIARAFREARDDGAVLLFDEVDSFLRDRRAARYSWEITLVNEFLEQLESFRGVVACTTNLADQLDQASRRRFTFSVEFRYLRPAQSIALFARMFAAGLGQQWDANAQELVRVALRSVTNLAPGDFALIAKRMHAIAQTQDIGQILSALLEESRAKKGARRPLGFESPSMADRQD